MSKPDLLRGRHCYRVGTYLLEVPADLLWAFPDGRYYERNVEYWFRHGISERHLPVVYDVGANCGYYSLVAAREARKVYAFEPVSVTRGLLTATVLRNHLSNIEVLGVAVGDVCREAQITRYNSSGNSSLVSRNPQSVNHLEVVGSEQVTVMTLDRLVADNLLLPPDVIKMDIEGSELSALRGARDTLRTHRPMLILEHDETVARDAGYLLPELRAELESLGYRVRGLRQDSYYLHDPDLALYDLDTLPVGELGTVVAVAA